MKVARNNVDRGQFLVGHFFPYGLVHCQTINFGLAKEPQTK